jgi:hypothetical protein
MRDGEELSGIAVRVEPIFAEGMRYLVEHCEFALSRARWARALAFSWDRLRRVAGEASRAGASSGAPRTSRRSWSHA